MNISKSLVSVVCGLGGRDVECVIKGMGDALGYKAYWSLHAHKGRCMWICGRLRVWVMYWDARRMAIVI